MPYFLSNKLLESGLDGKLPTPIPFQKINAQLSPTSKPHTKPSLRHHRDGVICLSG